jgi:hypothetical protein
MRRPSGRKGFNSMQIIRQQVALAELERMAASIFGDLVKAVVDVDRIVRVVAKRIER